MLELKNICKTYRVGDIETQALKNVSVSFREKEFVAILGHSGSGKTTFLNIVGGLDRYDGGELLIKGKSTRAFKEREWDAYRNNSVGFVFQSYNLITHLSIVENVELGMALSGVSAAKKRERAIELLTQMGLAEHLHKKPNQLSGGQMQRVAIARALANDPEILLCDEPTGALDSATSVQILDIIKQVSADRLVIMVTHNAELAEKYADRIIRFTDGELAGDTNPYNPAQTKAEFSLKRTAMSFGTALRLSANNLRTKKGRTFLTSFASSIGIIGIALIISLSSGFQVKIDEYQAGALGEFPVFISRSAMEVDEETMKQAQQQMIGEPENDYPDGDEVLLYDSKSAVVMHTNEITDEFIDYIGNIDPAICSAIGYTRMVSMNLLRRVNGEARQVSVSGSVASGSSIMSGMSSMGLHSYPVALDATAQSYLENNYELLAGSQPKSETDIVLIIGTDNRLERSVLTQLGFEVSGAESLKFSDIVGTELKLVTDDDFYQPTYFGTYMQNPDLESMYDSDKCITLTVCAVMRLAEGNDYSMLSNGIVYSDALAARLTEANAESEVVKAQLAADYNIFTKESVTQSEKENIIMGLGADSTPYMIMIYPTGFEEKDAVLNYLDAYNEGRSEDGVIIYTDLAATISDMTGSIIDGITIVLIAFAGVSLVVSLIMICIITYTSVLERTREIGILKALGARKKDITRVFDAETFILGVISGLLGIGIAWLLTIPVNIILYKLTDLSGVAQLPLQYALVLVALSTLLTVLGGHIPARMASRKDAVEALRAE